MLLLSLNISFLQSLNVCCVQKFYKELYITDGEVLCDCVCNKI